VSTERNTLTQEHAYYIWERQGRPYGRAFEHWLQAERELASNAETKAERDAATAAPPAAKKAGAKGAVRRTAATKKTKRRTSTRSGGTSR
jgi:hypothetical protein